MPTPTTPSVTTSSKQFSLNWKDAARGLLMAVVTPVLTTVYSSLQAGVLTINWKAIGIIGAGAGLAYLIKNFLSPQQTLISGLAPGDTTTVTIPEAGKAITVPPTGAPPVDATVAK